MLWFRKNTKKNRIFILFLYADSAKWSMKDTGKYKPIKGCLIYTFLLIFCEYMVNSNAIFRGIKGSDNTCQEHFLA